VASAQARPTTCRLTGNPASVKPQGRASAGRPGRLTGRVKLRVSGCAEAPFVAEPDPKVAAANGIDLEVQQSRVAWEPAEQQELISLCFNRRLADSAVLEAAAIEACPSGRVKKVDEDAFWNGCPLLQPFRASYICEPPTVVQVQ